MFEQGLSHYDVKPANILISTHGTWKVCDFGECGDITDEKEAKSPPRGTNKYWPPEYSKPPLRECHSVRADMWALGISFVEVIKGQHPYPPYMSELALAGYTDSWEPVVPTAHISKDLERLILHL
jgi:serine/threonine protein kinase